MILGGFFQLNVGLTTEFFLYRIWVEGEGYVWTVQGDFQKLNRSWGNITFVFVTRVKSDMYWWEPINYIVLMLNAVPFFKRLIIKIIGPTVVLNATDSVCVCVG